MKKIIFYDLDGTLADTRRDIAEAANHMRRSFGKREFSTQEVAQYVGRGLIFLIAGCLETDDPKMLEKGSKIYRDYYAAHMLDYTCLYQGVKETLDHFAGRKQVVITNKPNPFSEEILKALGIGHYFLSIIAGNSAFPKKPDPTAIFDKIKEWNASPAEALFIGDSRIDIETARNAGIEIAVISHGFEEEDALKSSQPDLLVPDFETLLSEAKKRQW